MSLTPFAAVALSLRGPLFLNSLYLVRVFCFPSSPLSRRSLDRSPVPTGDRSAALSDLGPKTSVDGPRPSTASGPLGSRNGRPPRDEPGCVSPMGGGVAAFLPRLGARLRDAWRGVQRLDRLAPHGKEGRPAPGRSPDDARVEAAARGDHPMTRRRAPAPLAWCNGPRPPGPPVPYEPRPDDTNNPANLLGFGPLSDGRPFRWARSTRQLANQNPIDRIEKLG
jgi:hypothetical protein